jgi:hypothetical protein
MPAERETLQHDLKEARENLALVDERIADYVLRTDVPLQLIKEQRYLKSRIRQIERRLAGQRPIEALRRVTKLMTGPLAETLTGAPWRALRQRLLTQASRLPSKDYLDSALLEAAAGDLAHLAHDVQVLLEARRIEPDSAQLEGLRRRARQLAGLLLRIYRLKPGEAPELDSLAAEPQDSLPKETSSGDTP